MRVEGAERMSNRVMNLGDLLTDAARRHPDAASGSRACGRRK